MSSHSFFENWSALNGEDGVVDILLVHLHGVNRHQKDFLNANSPPISRKPDIDGSNY